MADSSDNRFNMRSVQPIGRRTTFGHLHMANAHHQWGEFEVDEFPPSPKGEELRQRMVELGLGIRGASKKLGLSAVELSSLIRGRAVCDWDRLFRELETIGGAG